MADPVVKTSSGLVRGLAGAEGGSFRGIPYAAVPDGVLRFRPPVPAAGWDGVRDAVTFGTAPPQLAPAPGVPSAWRPGDGLDCLTLNVWTPDPGAGGLPVMVWIYGGLWKLGSSGMPQYDGAALASLGVVVVTVNYRVGFEGFGHLPGIPENRGLRDQIAALEWVQRNIAAFGGDPGRVTVFGQSAGGASVALLTAAPAAAGLFGRAIAQSVPGRTRTSAEAEQITEVQARAVGVAATWEGFAALAPEAILAVQDATLTGSPAALTAFAPVIDGDLIAGPPGAAIEASRAQAVDLVCGFTHQEYLGIARGPAPSDVDLGEVAAAIGLGPDAVPAYRAALPGRPDAEVFTEMMSDALIRMPTTWLAEAHAGAGGRTWLYDLTWREPEVGAGHSVDVPLVFGLPATRFAARVLGSQPLAAFAALSREMQAAWTSFAATGDPGWPRFDSQRRRTRLWDIPSRDADYPLPDSRRLWPPPAPR